MVASCCKPCNRLASRDAGCLSTCFDSKHTCILRDPGCWCMFPNTNDPGLGETFARATSIARFLSLLRMHQQLFSSATGRAGEVLGPSQHLEVWLRDGHEKLKGGSIQHTAGEEFSRCFVYLLSVLEWTSPGSLTSARGRGKGGGGPGLVGSLCTAFLATAAKAPVQHGEIVFGHVPRSFIQNYSGAFSCPRSHQTTACHWQD